MAKVVIVGGVAGGASCAARLRRLDETAEIILLERGEHISYANCGLPYYVGDVIRSKDALLVQKPEVMEARFRVDVRTQNEVLSIDREKKTVAVKKLETGEVYTQDYDKLVLATGSSPLRPPIPGIDSPRIRTLWTVPDTEQLRAMAGQAKSAAVIGGGFIGLEVAENLHHAGLEVSIVEMLDQVMAPLDYEMAQLLHEEMEGKGVRLSLGDGVDSFRDDGQGVTITLKSGKTLRAELVVLSIGVRPNGQLAKEAGLTVNARGGVVTDPFLRTSDPNIYAVGDVIQVEDLVFGEPTMIPLAGPANKQGRIAADNIAGGSETYPGTQGTSVAKVFDLTAASTGANEKTLGKRGLVRGRDYETVTIVQNSHAGYYPGATPLVLKLLFSMDGKKLFGAQIVGMEGVDKRIDTIAATLRLGGGVQDLTRLELAYAPPYSSAKDPVNMAGFTAENVLTGKVRFAPWDSVEMQPEAQLLDVREEAERMVFPLENAVEIPLGQLRDRLGELDRSKPVLVFCVIGVRGYNAARILMQQGFAHVLVYPGGTRFYQSTHYRQFAQPVFIEPPAEKRSPPECARTLRLDCSGMQCPGPIMKVFETMREMGEGEELEVAASDPGFVRDIAAWCRRTGNTLLSNGQKGTDYLAQIRKGQGDVRGQGAVSAENQPLVQDTPQGKTIVVFSGDLDKVLASFIIANGAAAMGRPVTMFFTFWGLTALRKAEKQPGKKSRVEALFGAMLPRGSRKLKLSRMNMGGMGTAMMKKIMQDKNVDSLEALMKQAMRQGVKLVACTMSMDVMGIRKEELIDGVELGGVGAYLGDAEESNVNLFV